MTSSRKCSDWLMLVASRSSCPVACVLCTRSDLRRERRREGCRQEEGQSAGQRSSAKSQTPSLTRRNASSATQPLFSPSKVDQV